MKPREQRCKVMIRARLRGPDGWHDACILNLSSRGLMLQTARPPGRGIYVEVRRGDETIVGRVIWTRGHRMGLKAQDPIAIDRLAGRPERQAPPGTAGPDRRKVSRPVAVAAESSRWRANAMQFAWLVLIAVGTAGLGFVLVEQALAQPIAALEAALSAG